MTSAKEQIAGHLANRHVRALTLWPPATKARSAYAAMPTGRIMAVSSWSGGVDDDDQDDHGSVGPVSGSGGQHRRRGQHHDQGSRNWATTRRHSGIGWGGQDIGAAGGEPGRCLRR